MTDDRRFTAPWERKLSRIRDEQPPEPGPRDPRPRADPPAPGTPASGTEDAPAGDDGPGTGGRRRLRPDAPAPHGRVTVADLIARIGHPGDAAPGPAPASPPPAAGDAPRDAPRDDPPAPHAAPGAGATPDSPSAPQATPPDGGPAKDARPDDAGIADVADGGAEPDEAGNDGTTPDGETTPDDSASADGAGTASDDADAGAGSWIRSALPLVVPGAGGAAHGGPHRQHNYWLRASHIAIALVSVLALVVTGAVWSYLRITDSQYTRVSALDQDSSDVRNPSGQYGDENYLIIGVDSRAGANSEVGAGTDSQVEGARSDTIMLVNIPANRERVVGVSFPRDLNIDRPSCERWDNSTGTYTDEVAPEEDDVKLNSAYAVGGPRCLVKVVQKLSGIKVNHFLGMDFAGFEAMVDTVGGVQVCTTRPLVDDELGTILPTAGTQTISGQTALEYVRARKVEAEGNGDYGRIKRQQMFLSSLLRAALSGKVLLDPGKMNTFINEFIKASFGDNLDTQALITLGRSLQNVDADQITFLTTPTDGTDDWGNETPRLTDIRNIFDAIIDDEPLPGEQPAQPPATTDDAPAPSAPATSAASSGEEAEQVHAMAPSSISVQVSNASTVNGFASATADQLGAEGFQIYSIGNHIAPVPPGTIVQFSGDNLAAAATVASSFPGAKLQRTDGLGTIVEVLLTDSSPQSVVSPATPGSVLTPVLAGDSSEPGSLPLDVSVVNAGDTSCG